MRLTGCVSEVLPLEIQQRFLQIITGLREKNGGPVKSSIIMGNEYLEGVGSLLSIGLNDDSLLSQLRIKKIYEINSFLKNEFGFTFNLLSFRRIIRAHNIYIHHGFYLFSLPLLLMFSKINSKIFIIPHGSFQKFSRQRSKLIKKLFCFIVQNLMRRKITVIFVAMTEAEVSDINDFFPESRVEVTGLGFDLEVPKKKITETAEPTFLCLSRITQKKRIDLCIEAISILKEHFPDAKLIIAGTGDELLTAELKNLALHLKVSANVKFMGHIGQGKNFENLFKSSALLLLPSEDENFALTVGEAIIRGLPVITSNHVGLSSVVSQFNCGRVIQELSAASLTDSILDAMSNWNGLVENCLENAKYFSHDQVHQRWRDLLEP